MNRSSFFRILFLYFICLPTTLVQAQEEEKRQQVQQMMVQQNVLPSTGHCYNSLLERGTKMLEAGYREEAHEEFRKALECPEVQYNNGYKATLETLMARCKTVENRSSSVPDKANLRADASTNATGGKGRYKARTAFLQFDSPNCFDITRQEADYAFAQGYWEDAASLYRAAKSCSDADQNERLTMNQRIELCRLAAENALIQKEKEAVRVARHALASNRANDAKELLRAGDRTMAFRLADFANSYIAPDGANDNPDCLQTMYDAWYYASNSGDEAEEGSIVPFCYQLVEDLGLDVQVRFAGNAGNSRLWAFSPEKHTVFSWDAYSLKPDRTFTVDTSYHSFDVSPDGYTLVFQSDNGLVLWRDAFRSYDIPVWGDIVYSFDPSGHYFHYYDNTQQQILTVYLNEVFASVKGYQQQRVGATKVRANGIGEGLLAFSFNQRALWLAYADSLVVLERQTNGSSWHREKIWRYPVEFGEDQYLAPLNVQLDPENGNAFVAWDTIGFLFHFSPDSAIATAIGPKQMGMYKANNFDTGKMAFLSYRYTRNDFQLRIADHTSGKLVFSASVPLAEGYDLLNGAISSNGRYFCMANQRGTIMLWQLDAENNTRIFPLSDSYDVALSPNGRWMATWGLDSLRVYDGSKGGMLQFASHPLPDDNAVSLFSGNQYLVYRYSYDSIAVWNWTTGSHFLFAAEPIELTDLPVALDENGGRIAMRSDAGTIRVYSLLNGKLLLSKAYEGFIKQLNFIPGSNKLLVVQFFTAGISANIQFIPKIWDLSRPEDSPAVIRLQSGNIDQVAVSAQGDQLAFSNGEFIQIYQLDNLMDEAMRIRPFGGYSIASMAFHPNGKVIAVGYTDGSVVFWEVSNGSVQFRLPAQGGTSDSVIDEISLADEGQKLRVCIRSEKMVEFQLDPVAIRAAAQDGQRQLLAFTSDQIRDFELDQALAFADNFEHLAMSGDLPLVRSFFTYYREQAILGTNIEKVSTYCDRAFRLYDQLDRASQEALQATMLEMYLEYNWKLLLRGKNAAAEKIVEHVNRHFGNPLLSKLMLAHAALLQGKLSEAAQNYAIWTIAMSANPDTRINAFDYLRMQFQQLEAYNLLQKEQRGCICALFDALISLGQSCKNLPVEKFVPTNNETDKLWSVFLDISLSDSLFNYAEKTTLLTGALNKALDLQKRYGQRYTEWVEKAVLALASAYSDWSTFEANAPEAISYRQQAISILEKQGAFSHFEQKRVRLLTTQYLKAGDFWYNASSPEKAMPFYAKSIEQCDKLLSISNQAEQESLRDGLLDSLLLHTGLMCLLLDYPEKALEYFNYAEQTLTYGINSLYKGHVALLQNRIPDAFIGYGGISQESEAGKAVAFIERMAAQIPAKRDSLLKYADLLLDNIHLANKDLRPGAIRYYRAVEKIGIYNGLENWRAALAWCDTSLLYAEEMVNAYPQDLELRNNWLEAQINQAYYLLFNAGSDTTRLSKSIRYSRQMLHYIEEFYNYYPYKNLIYTNLAHAYWLRNGPGDREKAVDVYRAFMATDSYGLGYPRQYDPWVLLYKDFRDLIHAGVQWPDMAALLQQIAPDKQLSEAEYRSLGINIPPNR